MNISARLLSLSVSVVGVLLATSSGAHGDSLYDTDFNSFTPGSIHGQDQWEAMDERGSWGDIRELGDGNRVLVVSGGIPGDLSGGEVRRLYNQASSRRFLTVTFDFLLASPEGWWFVHQYAPDSPEESLYFWGYGWARSGAEPGSNLFWTPNDEWHRIGLEVDQQARRMTFVMFDDVWLREDDTQGLVPVAQLDRFLFRGASEGSVSYPEIWIDNLSITDSDLTDATPYLRRQIPAPGESEVLPIQCVEVEIVDGPLAPVELESIVLTLDGASVSPDVTEAGVVTTAHYQPPDLYDPGSSHTVTLDYTAGDQDYHDAWEFRVASYPTLPPELRVTPETSMPGFIWRVSQLDLDGELPNSLERAEDQLAGRILDDDSQPRPNSADPNAVGVALRPSTPADPNWAPITFEIESVVNLNESGGGGDGGFGPDDQMPGIPGTGPHTERQRDNIAAEILSFIELPAGLVIMGVNSDDGFRTTVGNAADPATAVVLGQFDGGRAPADTLFAFEVEAAGVYPFRTIWEEGGGGSSIEWFTVKPDGTRVLINDVAKGGLRAYRSELLDPHPRIIKQPLSRVGAKGGEVTFAVTAAGAPELTFQWLKGGAPLVDDGRITGALTDRLTIASLVPDDAGPYSVRVSNAEGEVTSEEAALGVDDIPSPPNDYFAEATLLSGRRLVTASWNYGASAEVGEPRHGGQPASRSVWWRWTAPYGELVELKTDRSSLDTVLVVYAGSSLAMLRGVATNDNAGEWLNSRLVFWAEAGTTYSIAVDGKDGQEGSIWLWLNAEEVSTLMPLDHLGSWPGGNAGYPVAVWLAGHRAYVAQEQHGLAILDISDPASPVRLGGIQTPGGALDVCAVGEQVYVADGDQGIQVIRVTDPTRPIRVAGCPSGAYRVRAVGGLLYVAAGSSGLEILDISDPENPSRVGGFDTPAWVEDVDVANGIAYATDPPNGLFILSVTNPAEPQHLATYASPGNEVAGVRVAGSRAYVGLNVGGVDIVSVEDPAAPTLLGHYSPCEAQAHSMEATGDYAYVADGWGGLLILDVSNPANPVRAGSLTQGGFGRCVVVRDALAFVAVERNGVEIIDVTVPAEPVLRGAWDEAEYVQSVNAMGSLAFLATQHGLTILELSHPEAPVRLANTGSPQSPQDVELAGRYAYVTGDWDSVVEVFDVLDPLRPERVGSVWTDAGALDIQVRGLHAYVAGAPLTVLELRDPTAPQVIGRLDVGCCPRAISLSGDYAYVAALDAHLQIVNVATPEAPVQVGHYATPSGASGVATAGRLLYVTEWGGFEILDAANPAAPLPLASLGLGGLSVQVDGRYAYVAGGFEGIVVLDVRNPNLPAIAAQYRTRVHTERVHVADGRIYAADGRGGLVILANPFPANSPPAITDTPDQTMPVRVNPGDPALTVPFTVQDADTMADYLLVSVSSSDPALLPASAMVLGGSGTERSLELAPTPGAWGTVLVTVTVSDGRLETADTFLLEVVGGEVSLYATDFNSFVTGTIHGQDGWEAMDGAASWGNIIDLGGGNKGLAIVAGRPGEVWGGEVRRLYSQPSTRRFLTVTFDYLFTVQQGFWFMDNYAPEATPESLRFSDGQWVQSNAEPAASSFWTEPQQWHRIGCEVDQATRRITQIMFDGAWFPEDDTAGLAPAAQLDRLLFRGASSDFEGAQWYPELWIDNLAITDSDTTTAGPFLRRLTPAPGAADVVPIQAIEVEIVDGPLAAVEPKSIRLSLDGVAVSPEISKAGIVTVLHYQPPTAFPGNSDHAVSLNFAAGGIAYAHAWNFRVPAYPTLPPLMRVPPTAEPGFLWRVAQADLPYILDNSLQRAEEHLAGLIVGDDGQPVPNRANPAVWGPALRPAGLADPDWAPITFEIASVINLSEWGGDWVGGFAPDDQMPGIPGTGSLSPTDNIAAEILTLIELPVGLIVMGVNSDDGFRTTVGDPANPSAALVLGEFDGARGAADTLFAFAVKEPGVYPFRTIWEEGGGGANIEWFTVRPDGTRVLVNDVANGGFRAWRPTPPPSKYLTLPPAMRVMPSDQPGFLWRVAQADVPYTLPNSLQRAEEHLAGLILGEDGQPLPNRADPNAVSVALGPAAPADPYWAPITFAIPSVIKLNEWGGEWGGGFGPADPMPGIPGTGSVSAMENITAEILTLIELPAGLIVMGVNSDDGFRTTAGDPQDPCAAVVLGQFDGGRPPADTLFVFEVQEPGVYPFRTIWEEGDGGSSIAWFTVRADHSRVLVNDVANGGLRAWRPPVAPPPPPPGNEVVLTARCVASAFDIELAIERATAHGTRSGIVTLDAAAGDFIYTGPDRDIDIRRSNVTLRSLNGAVLANCGMGVVLGGASADNVAIEGLTFQCEFGGLKTRDDGPHDGAVLRNNVFRTAWYGVAVGGVRGWTIERNTIEAGAWQAAVGFFNSTGVQVSHNRLTGGDWVLHLVDVHDAELSHNEVQATDHSAIVLTRVSAAHVTGNTVGAPVDGIAVLDSESGDNRIINNTIALGQPGDVGINVSRSSGLKVANNDVSNGSLGIHFFESHDCEAVNNLIQGGWEGVLVGTGGCGHKIVNNQIHEIQSGGLSFEGGNFGNQVTANRVWCASPGACELIKAGDGPDFYRNNKVQANRLMR